MADRIRGITVELGGDTTGLSKALGKVNSEIKSTQNQLRDVERLLKLDPGNIDLLRQKQKLLNDAVTETKTKLDSLKQAQEHLDQNGVDKNSAQYMALQREIVATSSELEKLEKAASQSNASLAKVGATFDKISSASGKVASATKGLSVAAGGALAGLAGAAYKAVTASDDLNTLAKQTGFTTEEIQKMQYASDFVDVSFDDIAGAATKMRKQLSSSEDKFEALGVATRDANGNFRDSNEIFYDTIQALSNIENETERDVAAMDIFGKSADSLAGIVDDGGKALKELGEQAEEAGVIMSQDTLDSLNAVNDQIDTLKANARGALAQSGAKAMQALMPIFDSIIQKLTNLFTWISNLDAGTLKTITTVLAIIAAISPVAGLISKITGAVSGLMPVVSGVITFIAANPVVAIIAAIVAAVTALTVLVVKHWDEIKAALEEVGTWLMDNIVTPVVDFFTGMWESIKTAFANGWAAVKDAFASAAEWVGSIFQTDWSDKLGLIGEPLNLFLAQVKNIWETVKGVFTGIIDFVKNVFTGNWKGAWEAVKDIFKSVFEGLENVVKTPLNAIIKLVNGVINGLNSLINGLNKISFDVPDWVPGMGGKSFGINIPKIKNIPYLARGGILSQGSAVVGEAGAELLTVAGGKAIVQPLTNTSRIEGLLGEINGNLGGGGTTTIVVQSVLDGKVIGETAYKYSAQRARAFG